MAEVLRLPSEPIAPALARASVTGVARSLSDVALADLNLLLTEVVSNAVRHGRITGADEIVVAVDVADDRVTVSVSDTAPGVGVATSASELAADNRDGGWGVFLLKRLASEWGIDRHDDKTTVWFSIDR